ncbi:lebocin-4-like [Pararge aegeria]|nr:lebocin-4-like [Pararge aegeria]
MFKLTVILFLAVYVDYALSQRFILPTYRPPPRRPVLRRIRDVGDQEPLWLNEDNNIPRAPATGDHPVLPSYIDDMKLDPNRRYVRDVSYPQWLYQGDNIPRAPASSDHPVLPNIIDDIKLDLNRRYARSVDSPSARRSGGSRSKSSRSHDTGRTHPGYNRRNA